MKKTLFALAVVAVLTLVLAACGDKEEQEVEKEATVAIEKEATVVVEKVRAATPTPPPATGEAKFGGNLRITAQGSVSTLDPVYSFFAVVGSIASHFYEGLFGWDGNLNAQPRGLDSFSISPDGLTWTFKLREMKFHDGSPFESQDAIASLQRAMDTGMPGITLVNRFSAEDGLKALDTKIFTWTFTEPFGGVPIVLANPHPPLAMMRAEDAATPFTEPVTERIGTAAYKFVSWDQGDKIVLERFQGYITRDEPSSPGTYAGKNVAYLDQLIWLEIPDEETKIAGLETGEWDVVDNAGLDFYKRLKDNPDLQVSVYKPGKRSDMILNPQITPFKYLNARRAIMTGIDVDSIMISLGDPDLWITCAALYWCGTPLDTTAGSSYTVQTSKGPREIGYDVNDMETAKLLLQESEYAGETVVLLNPTDYGTITPLGHVLKPVMEEIGFNVEMPALDWATITGRFGATGTWSAATSWYEHFALGNPVTDLFLAGTLDFFGRDEKLIELQLAYAREQNPQKQLEIVDQISMRRWEVVLDLSLGVFFPISPATKDLKGFEVKAINFYTNTWLDR
ncbi:MAG: hypothetical protein FJ312_06415 [SAR202 cluster bacterium]|nr:hypothetical protein [SAR202 cluster bacterium]